MRIEQALSKDRILELYLNEIYLGLQSYGVAAAAQAYFNKSLDELTLAEAAFLAALPKAPNNYNPFRFPEAARARRDWVLDRMAEDRRHHRRAGGGGQGDADHRRRPSTGRSRSRAPTTSPRRCAAQLIDRFGAGRDDAGRAGGAHHARPGACRSPPTGRCATGCCATTSAHGGWRGPVARLPAGPQLRTGWAAALAAAARPPGMLPDWRLGVVLDVSDDARRSSASSTPRRAPRRRRRACCRCSSPISAGRAPPPHDGEPPGPPPRRVADVVQPGDVVMVEPAARRAGARQGAGAAGAAAAAPDPAGRGRAGLARPGHRARAGDERRLVLRAEPVQPRHPGAAPAGLELQAVRLSDRAGAGHLAGAALPRRAVRDRSRRAGQWRPGNYEGDFMGADAAARGAGESR